MHAARLRCLGLQEKHEKEMTTSLNKVKDSTQAPTVTSLAIHQDQDHYAERLTLLF